MLIIHPLELTVNLSVFAPGGPARNDAETVILHSGAGRRAREGLRMTCVDFDGVQRSSWARAKAARIATFCSRRPSALSSMPTWLLTPRIALCSKRSAAARTRCGVCSKLCSVIGKLLGWVRPLHPHLFRHQMLTFLTGQKLSDAQIQLLSGHAGAKNYRNLTNICRWTPVEERIPAGGQATWRCEGTHPGWGTQMGENDVCGRRPTWPKFRTLLPGA